MYYHRNMSRLQNGGKTLKTLFNFYLDDDLKKEVNEKLIRLNGEKNKGQLSALIRVLLRQFNMTPDDKVNLLLLECIDDEYEISATLNKRSKL